MSNQVAVALVEQLALGVHDLAVPRVVPEEERMRRSRDRVRTVVDAEHHGLQKEQVPQDFVGVLPKGLEELLVALSERAVERLVGGNER